MDRDWPPDCDLSSKGEKQAETLGKEWKDVHIDYLYSSTMKRTYETALAVSTHNKGQPQVMQDEMLVKRKMGQVTLEFARKGEREAAEDSFYGKNKFDREYQPPGGGESMSMLSARACSTLVELLKRHGKDMDTPPDLPGLWGPGLEIERNTPEITTPPDSTLVDGLPHVVVVSHNAFLTMFYEEMYSWDSQWRSTDCGYHNTAWWVNFLPVLQGSQC